MNLVSRAMWQAETGSLDSAPGQQAATFFNKAGLRVGHLRSEQEQFLGDLSMVSCHGFADSDQQYRLRRRLLPLAVELQVHPPSPDKTVDIIVLTVRGSSRRGQNPEDRRTLHKLTSTGLPEDNDCTHTLATKS